MSVPSYYTPSEYFGPPGCSTSNLSTVSSARLSGARHVMYGVPLNLFSQFRWLDTTPTSRIITRATQDMGMIDGPIATALWSLADQTVSMAVTFGAIVLFTPVFLGPGIVLFILGTYFGRLFMPARISVKREMSNTRAPVLGQ